MAWRHQGPVVQLVGLVILCLLDIASACFRMSFIFVLFMLHLLTVCALYVCLCDYVNMCMYLVLLCIFGRIAKNFYLYLDNESSLSFSSLFFAAIIYIFFSIISSSNHQTSINRNCADEFSVKTSNKTSQKLNFSWLHMDDNLTIKKSKNSWI
jgi:hypothetical protein